MPSRSPHEPPLAYPGRHEPHHAVAPDAARASGGAKRARRGRRARRAHGVSPGARPRGTCPRVVAVARSLRRHARARVLARGQRGPAFGRFARHRAAPSRARGPRCRQRGRVERGEYSEARFRCLEKRTRRGPSHRAQHPLGPGHRRVRRRARLRPFRLGKRRRRARALASDARDRRPARGGGFRRRSRARRRPR